MERGAGHAVAEESRGGVILQACIEVTSAGSLMA